MRRFVVAVSMLMLMSSHVAFAQPFPPGTKRRPAKTVQLRIDDKQVLEIDFPERPGVVDDLLAFTVLQAARARREERRLLEPSAPYATYAKRVGFLLPGLGRRA